MPARPVALVLVLPLSLAVVAGGRGAPPSGPAAPAPVTVGASVPHAAGAAPRPATGPGAATARLAPPADVAAGDPAAGATAAGDTAAGATAVGDPAVGATAPGATPPAPPSRLMATVPAGRYMPLYAPDAAAVAVESFRMDRFPVTREDFAAFVEAKPEWRRSGVKPVFADDRYLVGWEDDLSPDGPARAPVTGVSWFAARAYCQWEGKRLPTVDEWEYAARADETRTNAMADPSHKARILELYTQRPDSPRPVGSSFENLYGVHDMHGLVWEWIRDFNTVTVGTDSRGTAQRDDQLYCAAGAEGATDTENYAAFLRYAFRASLAGRSTSGALGFRCADDL